LPVEAYLFIETIAIYIILGWAIYLVYRIGDLYVIPIFTMGFAAYFTAIALRDWGWSYGPTLLAAIAMGGGIGFLIGLPLARASGFALAIASMAPMIIFQSVVRSLGFLGGSRGLQAIPRVSHLMPITLAAVSIVGFFIYRLDHSRVGRAMEVISVSDNAAATQGVSRYKMSLFLQTTASALGALAGALYAPLVRSVVPVDYGFPLLLNIVSFFFVGGYTTMWGVVTFTPLLWGLRLILPSEIVSWTLIIYGALLVIVILLRPEGVVTKQILRSIRLSRQALFGQK
jgi:branched-chain amino acid transport system permease protein